MNRTYVQQTGFKDLEGGGEGGGREGQSQYFSDQADWSKLNSIRTRFLQNIK